MENAGTASKYFSNFSVLEFKLFTEAASFYNFKSILITNESFADKPASDCRL